jgi:hypothetical protein
MSAKEDAARNARRAAALKDNLKRRKAQARARAETDLTPAKGLGTAPQAGLEGKPDKGPNAAKKLR